MVIIEEKKCTCNISSSFFPSIFPTVISLVPFKMFKAAWGWVSRWWMFAASRRYFCFGYSNCKGGFHSTRLSTIYSSTTHMRTHVKPQSVLMWPNLGIPPLLFRITYSYPRHFPDCGDNFWSTKMIIDHHFYIVDEDIFTLTWVASVYGVLVEAGSIVIEGSNIVAVTNCKYCKDCKY